MYLTVKETVLEIKEVVFGGHNIDAEKYLTELSERTWLTFDDIKDIFNNISLIYIDESKPEFNLTKKKLWTKGEDQLMLMYVDFVANQSNEKNGHKKKTKSSIFEELSDILVDRTAQSISFRYYEMKRETIVKKDKSIQKVKPNLTVNPEVFKPKIETINKSDDLLDIVINLVDNVETAGVDINGLFKGLLTMSQRAVENSNVHKVKDLEEKSEELEGKVEFLELELEMEKNKNESLQLEVAKLISEFNKVKTEIEYFNGLNGKQKLQQLQNFNRNIKYMVDKFGGVISVGVENAG